MLKTCHDLSFLLKQNPQPQAWPPRCCLNLALAGFSNSTVQSPSQSPDSSHLIMALVPCHTKALPPNSLPSPVLLALAHPLNFSLNIVTSSTNGSLDKLTASPHLVTPTCTSVFKAKMQFICTAVGRHAGEIYATHYQMEKGKEINVFKVSV